MKKFLGFLSIAAALTATSCDDETTTSTPDSVDTVLSGDITSDLTLMSGETYTLAAGVHVKSGATLTIEPGVVVKNDPTEAVAYLLIEKGGKIMAEGTAANPIVFTSDTQERGAWGGIIVNGNAPVNGADTNGERTAEVGNVKYGGSVSDDNSGVLKYIRLEYTGNAINEDKEHNGFTFNGVGSGTTVSYLQSYMGGDDGFEFFGGTVNASNLLSTGSKDDSFDWTYGWTGNGTNWIADQEGSDLGDRGIEADNNKDNRTAAPYSNPTLTNITLKGRGVSAATDAIKLREGTKATITNIKISNFEDGFSIDHNETLDNVAGGSLTVTNATLTAVTNNIKYAGTSGHADAATKEAAAEAADNIEVTTTATGADESMFTGWTVSIAD